MPFFRVIAFILLIFALQPARADERQVVFANGRVEVTLPDTFKVTSNLEDGLVATFGDNNDHRLELTLNEVNKSSQPTDSGEQFVRTQATQKGKRLSAIPGKVVFMDPAGDMDVGGVRMRVVHWQIGFGRSVVVMTLTAPVEQPMSPALHDFLGKPLNVLVSSLRRKD